MQQNHGLPFPPDQLIGGSWFENPMAAQLPVPQKPVFQQNPNLNWVLAMTAGLLVTNLQNNAQGGPVSAFAYNLFSSNGYNNQPWLIIVDEASDFALQQLQMNPNANGQQVVQAAVTFYAGYAAAACVMKWPALQAFMMPQQVQRVQQIIQEWNNMQQPMHQHQQPAQAVNYAVSVGAGITSPHAGSYALNMNHLEQNSKFGNVDRKRAVPDALRKAEPTGELKDLGVIETSGIGDRQAVTQNTAQVEQVYIAPTHRPRARPKPEPIGGGQPVQQSEPQQPAAHVIGQAEHTSAKWTAAPVEAPQGVSQGNDIPSLDILGDDDSQWADQIDAGRFEFDNAPASSPAPVEMRTEPVEEYRVTKTGRFIVRPKHPDVELPINRDMADLEEEEDLEIIEVTSLPQGEDDVTVLELEDGNVAVQVLASDTGRTWTADQPHNHPYNPATHFRYLVHVDDHVAYEAFMPRDPDVKYEDLEFNSAVRAKARQDRLSDQTILADLSVLTEITPRGTPFTIIGALDDLEKANNSADQSASIEMIEQFQGKLSWFEGIQRKPLAEVLFAVDRLFDQVKARNTVPVVYGQTEHRFIVNGLGKKVSEVTHAPIKTRLAKVILFVRDLESFGPRAFVHVNQVLTKIVNRILDFGLGFVVYSITNFVEDYFDLLEVIEKDFGTDALDKLNDAINDAVAHLGFDYTDNVLSVTQTYCVVGLPIGLASFGMYSATGESYTVLSSNAPELHGLLEEAKRDEARPRNPVTYLSGRDGEVFEVVESVWDDSYKTLVRL